MSRSKSLSERRQAVMPTGAAMFLPESTAAKGRGAILFDADGREIIDFAGGIGVLNVGHCHPEVVRAIQSQADQLMHTCAHVAIYEPYVSLCEKLVQLFPHGDRTKVYLSNSGAEAVENAIKIARQATGRDAVVCFTESFHGRTLMALTLTSKTGYKLNCGPFAPEVYRLPYPNIFRYGNGLDEPAFVARELQRFRAMLVHTVPAEHIAAVIIEAVQGEGGFVPAPAAYLKGLRSICDEFGIVLIFDEVQSGFCRTGAWASYQHAGVTPDLSVWAKSLGGGLPISAILGRADIMDKTAKGTLGGTYGGNAVSCAAALAAINVMEKENLNARAQTIGAAIRKRFESIRSRAPHIVADVRGVGAMIAMELVEDPASLKPATALTAAVVRAAHARGLLLVTAGAAANIIRVLCPLVITDEQLERGLSILEEELLKQMNGSPAQTPAHTAAAR